MPQQMGYPGINMGQAPAVFSQPQQMMGGAQVFSSGVPGAPPTIAVSTDGQSMNQFASPPQMGPRPQKAGGTRRRQHFGGGSDAEQTQSQSSDAHVTIRVIKGD